MKTHFKVLISVLIIASSFLAGYWLNPVDGRGKPTAERKILYYVDPMNPAFRSDKPGIAPCGMPLEPVYPDPGDTAEGGADLRASMPPGAIRISPGKQQLIGVKTAVVEKVPWSHSLRVLGRVTSDETRTYRINAAVNGWIEDALPITTGSLVKENDILATYSSLEYRSVLLNFFNLITISREGSPGEKAATQPARYSTSQLRQLREVAGSIGQGKEGSQIEYYRRSLYNYGMSPHQVDEMERTMKIPDVIEIRAPIGGFILYRNVSPGLRFDRGAEFFRIADLSRVWILADIFETEASHFKPGMRVKMELPYEKRTLHAEVSPVLPQFDPATRTLKVRLVADNPGYVMRPDMFVNVQIPLSGPPTIIVPVDAVLDSGLKKTVFVDKGNGYFEPRQVETKRTLGERVEIARGLVPGEKIVVSGNFLIDSEARMQQAASGITGKIGRDPVCRMNVDEDRAKAEGNVWQYKGKSYFFCMPECRDNFSKDPERYLKSSQARGAAAMGGSQDAPATHSSHAPAPVSKQRGAKAAPGAHDGMTMTAAQPPAAMPGTPSDSPKTESKKTKSAAIPSPAAPVMGPQSPTLSGKEGMPMTMPQVSPGQGPGVMPMPGPSGAAPMPGGKAREQFPSATGTQGMNQGPPAFPAQGNMPGPMPQGTAPRSGPQPGSMTPPSAVPGMGPGSPVLPGPGSAPGPMPQQVAPLPEAQTGEIAPPAPATRTLRINPRLRNRPSGDQPQDGPQGPSPMPGPKTRRPIPRAAGTPGVNQELPPSLGPGPRGMPLPGSTDTAPRPGSPDASQVSGPQPAGAAPAGTGTPEVKR